MLRAPAWLPHAGLLVAAACAASSATPGVRPPATPGPIAPLRVEVEPALRASPWPEADRLFRSDPHWLGGDAALTVELAPGRILWLFGDSFVSMSTGTGRRGARMLRNSVAVQRGGDPSRAELTFYWRTDDAGLPESFFPEPEQGFYWPGHGIVLDGALTLFLHRVLRAPDSPLGFVSSGFAVVRVDEPESVPTAWLLRALPLPAVAKGEVIGAAVLEREGFVYASLVHEPGDHSLSLVRWRRDDFVAGQLLEMERWDGTAFGAGPSASIADAVGTELSLSAKPRGGFVLVHSGAFGGVPLMVRFAPALTGPWSEPSSLYRPPETARDQVLIYAAKAHPELEGAPIVATYATNTLDADALLDDLSLYFPRFVRIWTR